MAWWSREKKMEVDNIEVQLKAQPTDPSYKIEPISEDTYRVYDKAIFGGWDYRKTFSTFKEAEEYVREQTAWARQQEEKRKRDKEFQAANPPKYFY
jgi:hypothetical protein